MSAMKCCIRSKHLCSYESFEKLVIDITEKSDLESKSVETVSQNLELRFSVTFCLIIAGQRRFQMQEDQSSTIELQTVKRHQTTSQTIINKPPDDQSKNCQPSIDSCSQMEDDGNEELMRVETTSHISLVKSFWSTPLL